MTMDALMMANALDTVSFPLLFLTSQFRLDLSYSTCMIQFVIPVRGKPDTTRNRSLSLSTTCTLASSRVVEAEYVL